MRFRFACLAAGLLLWTVGCNDHPQIRSGEADPSPVWEPLPAPPRATVISLTRGPGDTLYAATRAGLYASSDLGRTWHPRGSADLFVGPLVILPDGSFVAGAYRTGVLRSDDGGRSWRPLAFADASYVHDLLLDGDRRILAAVDRESGQSGLYASADGGRSWEYLGFGDTGVRTLSSVPHDVILAGTTEGLFRSSDHGATWRPVEDLPTAAPVTDVIAIGDTLFAGTGVRLHGGAAMPGDGVIRSTDGGHKWERMDEGLPPGTTVHALMALGGGLVAATGNPIQGGGAGVYRSTDLRSWRPWGLEGLQVLSLAGGKDLGVFAGTGGPGVFHTPGSATWTRRSDGLRNWEAFAMAMDSSGTLFAATQLALYASSDGGERWEAYPFEVPQAGATPWGLVVAPSGDLVLAGKGAVRVSADEGRTWHSRTLPAPGTVRMLRPGPSGRLHVAATSGFFTTPDEGRSWQRLDVPMDGDPFAILELASGVVLASREFDGIFRSDGAGHWERVRDDVYAFSFQSCGGERVLAATYGRGIFRSDDGGRTWTPVTEEIRQNSNQPGYVTFTSIECVGEGNLLAGTLGDGTFFSADGGGTWVEAGAGLLQDLVASFSWAPDGTVYAATPSGLHVSRRWAKQGESPRGRE